MRKLKFVILATLLVFNCGADVSSASDDRARIIEQDFHSISVDGQRRSYLLHVPKNIKAREPLPLLLVFHGGSQNAAEAAKITGFNDYSDAHHFFVAYPDSLDGYWNDGRGSTRAEKEGTDDVKFVRELIAVLFEQFPVDPARIYATGMSNGGVFSHRLGCELSNVLAAIGPEIGGFPTKFVSRCQPTHPVSVISIQGTADPLIPIHGGEAGGRWKLGAGGLVESAEDSYNLWATKNGCKQPPETTFLHPEVFDGTSVKRITFVHCSEATEVMQYIVNGMGHRWPSRYSRTEASRIGTRLLGPTTGNIDATAVIWEFFQAHPKTGSADFSRH